MENVMSQLLLARIYQAITLVDISYILQLINVCLLIKFLKKVLSGSMILLTITLKLRKNHSKY